MIDPDKNMTALLVDTLKIAVRLHIMRLYRLSQDDPEEFKDQTDDLTGDNMAYRVGGLIETLLTDPEGLRGDFDTIAQVVAALAFSPNGVRFLYEDFKETPYQETEISQDPESTKIRVYVPIDGLPDPEGVPDDNPR